MQHDEERKLDGLMAALADGDRSAFEPLFHVLHPLALRVARARLRDDARAADAAQAALVKLFSRASDFEPGRAVLPWFYGILANEVRALGRVGARETHDHAALETLAVEGDPETELTFHELRGALEDAVARLDAPSAEAIAAILGEGAIPAISPAAFRKRVSRAYARMRVLLGGSR